MKNLTLASRGSITSSQTEKMWDQEVPTIETADADFNVLGVQLRGYHDFGVAPQDPRGAIKSKGEV
ncbi:MAG: hypothetical protein SGI77_07670 [Pirellulaceae bacterium]|nr:hypothetical protein [Pirellulaceae bacterium]